MNANLIGIIVILVLVLVICVGVGVAIRNAYKKACNTVASYSRAIFGTSNPVEGMKKVELENASTPKSVASATGLYLPRIVKDFPEFQYEEMKSRAENLLISYLRCLEERSLSSLTEGMEELKNDLRMKIQMLQDRECKAYYQRIQVHRTEISQYRKERGRCSIVFQSSVEYIHYVEKEGKVIEGRKDMKTQSRYNVEVSYIQDRDFIANTEDAGLGLNCPNCGAPLPGVGAKKCPYCDTPIVEFNIRVWNFSSVKEV